MDRQGELTEEFNVTTVSKTFVTWEQIYQRVSSMRMVIQNQPVWGPPRGGQIVAGLIGNAVSNPNHAKYIVDDLVDSGRTKARLQKEFPDKSFIPLFTKENPSSWLVFPWEVEVEEDPTDNVVRLLQALGVDTTDSHLVETPSRVLKSLREMTAGYGVKNPVDILKPWNNPGVDQIITVTNIPFSSLCAHHLLPFFGAVSIGYIPDKFITGLSKLPRIVEAFSKRLQVQEVLTEEVALTIHHGLGAKGVGVITKASHCCMSCRGIKAIGAEMLTSSMLGVFRDVPTARMELLTLLLGGGNRG